MINLRLFKSIYIYIINKYDIFNFLINFTHNINK